MLFKKGVAEHCFRRIRVPFCLFVAIQSIVAAKIRDLRFGGNTGSTKKTMRWLCFISWDKRLISSVIRILLSGLAP